MTKICIFGPAILLLAVMIGCSDAQLVRNVEGPWESYPLNQSVAEEIMDRGGRYHKEDERAIQVARGSNGEVSVRTVARGFGTKLQGVVTVDAAGNLAGFAWEEFRVRTGRRGALRTTVSRPEERFSLERFYGVNLENARARLVLNEDWTFIPVEYRRYSDADEKIRAMIIEALVVSREVRALRRS